MKIQTPSGHFRSHQCQPARCARLRDRKSELPEAANGQVKALRQVFKYAIAAEIPGAERNPARDVPYIKTGSQGSYLDN